MAIDLKGWGWVTPPQNYNAVYSLSDNIRKEKQGEQERAEKNASAKCPPCLNF